MLPSRLSAVLFLTVYSTADVRRTKKRCVMLYHVHFFSDSTVVNDDDYQWLK